MDGFLPLFIVQYAGSICRWRGVQFYSKSLVVMITKVEQKSQKHLMRNLKMSKLLGAVQYATYSSSWFKVCRIVFKVDTRGSRVLSLARALLVRFTCQMYFFLFLSFGLSSGPVLVLLQVCAAESDAVFVSDWYSLCFLWYFFKKEKKKHHSNGQ